MYFQHIRVTPSPHHHKKIPKKNSSPPPMGTMSLRTPMKPFLRIFHRPKNARKKMDCWKRRWFCFFGLGKAGSMIFSFHNWFFDISLIPYMGWSVAVNSILIALSNQLMLGGYPTTVIFIRVKNAIHCLHFWIHTLRKRPTLN